jgi:aldehyde:ferredoxin oxidoreductase
MALLHATSDRGGCHVRGNSLRFELMGLAKPMDRLGYEGKASFVVELQRLFALMNSYSECLFAGFGLILDDYAAALSSLSGDRITPEGLLSAGKRIWDLTRLFNAREGFTRDDDTLPARLFEEPLPAGPAQAQVVDRHLFDRMKDEYYELQGWDL